MRRIPKSIEFESTAIDRQIFNRDTSRHVLRNLMENGIRDHTGQLTRQIHHLCP